MAGDHQRAAELDPGSAPEREQPGGAPLHRHRTVGEPSSGMRVAVDEQPALLKAEVGAGDGREHRPGAELVAQGRHRGEDSPPRLCFRTLSAQPESDPTAEHEEPSPAPVSLGDPKPKVED